MKTTLEKPEVKKPSGKIETRAKAFADELAENCRKYGPQDFHVEWKKSRMYGRNPVIHHDGGKCTDISGCGYDKLSACLSSVLHWIFPEPVNLGSGSGVRRVIDNMKERGWVLDHTVSGKDLDVFTLALAPDVEEKPDPAPIGPDSTRADRAARLLAVYKQWMELDYDPDESALSDMLADFMHWSHRERIDFAERHALAQDHFREEQAEG